MAKFDLAVLGGGPGGYVAAIRGAQLGLKTCVIDQDKLGGICLNWGCIPTKALLKNAEVYHYIKNADTYGINVGKVSVDFKKNIKRSRDVSNRLSKGIEFLIKKNKITHIQGTGKLTSKTSLEVKNKQKTDTIEADKIILATGARPKSFPGMEFDGNRVISFKEAMILDSPPKKMIIIGSGAIGSEFAYYYNEFGTEVHLIEMMDRILPVEDSDVSKEVAKSFKKSEITISTETKVSKIESLKTKVKVHIEKKGKKEILEGDVALLAVGVTGNIENIGLEEVGVQRNNGFVKVNLDSFQTSVPNIYAAGDIVEGTPQLAHVGFAEGIAAITHIATGEKADINYDAIPYVVYTSPELAEVGINTENAKEKDIKISNAQHSFVGLGRAIIQDQNNGVVRVFYEEDGPIVGASVCGPAAGEVIHELMYMVGWEVLPKEAADFIHAHPTLSEAVGEALMSASGRGLH